jgi:hypothetical protein
MTDRAPIPIRCACGTPVAEILADGTLRLVAKHHGGKHERLVTLAELVELRRRLEVPSPT